MKSDISHVILHSTLKGEAKKLRNVQYENVWQKLKKLEIKMQTSIFYVHEVKMCGEQFVKAQ